MADERLRCEEAGMDELLVKPVALDKLAQIIASLLEEPAFDMATLQRLTQANAPMMQRMLDELASNLLTEARALDQARQNQDWQHLDEIIHRLKGIASLIDAMPLARAIAGVAASCRERSLTGLDASWPPLESAIAQLQQAIARSA
jgi:two-component system sensor histidine kinase EvgS